MNGHRICIICLPRSGSQLCEILSGEKHSSLQLGEYFENWNRSEYIIDEYNTIRLKNFASIPTNFQLFEGFEERLNLLKNTNTNQSLTLRIFLMDQYNKDTLSNIIIELKNIGFEFITLKRDIKEQLLSYMVARTYVKNVFGINSGINQPVYINLIKFNKVLTHIYDSHLLWEKNLSLVLHNIEYQKVNYESIHVDMENIYNTKFKYQGEKSIKGDPFDLIINKEEVMDFLTNL
jgi:predicted DNA-binding protein YlxM (UPF0122 family)